MDWMVTGAPPPTGTPPTKICFVMSYVTNFQISLKVTTTISKSSRAKPAPWIHASYFGSSLRPESSRHNLPHDQQEDAPAIQGRQGQEVHNGQVHGDEGDDISTRSASRRLHCRPGSPPDPGRRRCPRGRTYRAGPPAPSPAWPGPTRRPWKIAAGLPALDQHAGGGGLFLVKIDAVHGHGLAVHRVVLGRQGQVV